MSAIGLRCCCRRCCGSVTYARMTDFIEAHQLGPNEFVLDREVVAVQGEGDIWLTPPRVRSLFAIEVAGAARPFETGPASDRQCETPGSDSRTAPTNGQGTNNEPEAST